MSRRNTSVNCSVATCENSFESVKRKGLSVRFHNFPKDPRLRAEWIKLCNRKHQFNPKSKRICSAHFATSDYEDGIKAKIMDTQARRLKKDAVPTLLLPVIETVEINDESEDPINENTAVEVEVNANSLYQDAVSELFLEKQEPESSMCIEDETNTKISDLQDSLLLMKQRLEALEKENLELHKRLIELETKKRSNERLTNAEFEKRAEEKFKKFLSPNQVAIVLRKVAKVDWTHEELLKAYILKRYSTKSYNYVKKTLNYPLPGIAVLEKWKADKRKELRVKRVKIPKTNHLLHDHCYV